MTIATGEVVRRESNLRRLELAVTRKLDGLLLGEHLAFIAVWGVKPARVGLLARRRRPADQLGVTARSSELHVHDTIADCELET